MALTGKFEADFEQFTSACRQAEVSLKGFEGGSAKVESQLNRMADSFSGRRVIQEAQLAAAAIEKMGGTSRLTQSELARVNGLASEAADKFRAWGQEVPPNIAKLEAATKSASGGMTGMAKAIADTDNVLDLFGVNLGPARRALDDLGTAGGKTAAQLGAVGTASLAAGAALAGWEIGRKIAEFAELDEKVSNATAKLLGWGDVAGEKAAAKADMLAKASKEVGFQVTSVSTAMAINQAAADATTAANKRLSDQFVAEAEAAKKAGAEIERVHQSNADKVFKLTQDWVAAMHAREQAEIDAAAKGKQALFDEIDAAMKDAEAHKKLRDAGIEAQDTIKTKTAEATEALVQQVAVMQKLQASMTAASAALFGDQSSNEKSVITLSGERITPAEARRRHEAGGSVDVSTEAGARALLSVPEKTIDDFVRLYTTAQGMAPMEYIRQIFANYQESIRRAKQTLGLNPNVYGADLSRGIYGGGGARTVNMTVSGVLDPRTINEIKNAVGIALVRDTGAKVGI